MSVAKTMALVYFAISLVLVPIFLLAAVAGAFAGSGANAGFGAGLAVVFAIVMPVMYALFGFLGGALCAAIYNLVAARFGGGIIARLDPVLPAQVVMGTQPL
ncbi:MAG TPA: hypothetical protein VE998_04235 [Terriglobales bacterium]|nr:hypothetical protein [Terriglobales bacterium]